MSDAAHPEIRNLVTPDSGTHDFVDGFGGLVERRIRAAMDEGRFGSLPGTGRPLPRRWDDHHPDWWARRKVESIRGDRS